MLVEKWSGTRLLQHKCCRQVFCRPQELSDNTFRQLSTAAPYKVMDLMWCYLNASKEMLSEDLPLVLMTFYDISSSVRTCLKLFYLLILSVRIWDWKEARCGWLPVLTDESVCGLPIGWRKSVICWTGWHFLLRLILGYWISWLMTRNVMTAVYIYFVVVFKTHRYSHSRLLRHIGILYKKFNI